jgi:hypothetical protein
MGVLLQPSLGRQPVARWYFPPEVDYRLSLLHPDAKGLVVWVLEAKVCHRSQFLTRPLTLNLGKIFSSAICFCHRPHRMCCLCLFNFQVLSKAELQFLAMLPDLRPKVRVIAECGNW